MFAYYLRVEKVFLENKKAHTGQIKGITAGLKPTEKQKKFDTFTVSNLIYYNGAQNGIRTHTVSLPVDFESTAATITPSGQMTRLFYHF